MKFLVLIGVVMLYVAVRLWGLTASCLWFDEIFSVHAAEHDWSTILNFVSLDLIHPPLFYVLLKLWISIGGDGLLWLRLFPVAWSVLAVFPFIALCRELRLSRWIATLALFLVAVNGSLIKYSQEVRMYAPLMCLSLFSMWLFVMYFHRGKSLVPLIIVNVLMVYTHYFGWLVLASEVFLIVCFQRIKWRPMAAMTSVVFAAFLPWIIAVFSAARAGSDLGQNIGWMTRPGFVGLTVFTFDLIEPFYYQASSTEPTSAFRVSAPVLLILVTAGILFLVNWKAHDDDTKRRVYFLSAFVAAPVVIAWLASWLLPYSIFGTRHLIVVFAPLLMVAGIFITHAPRTFVIAAVTILILLAGYAALPALLQPRILYPWCGWSTAADQAKLAGATRLFVTEDLGAYQAWFPLRGSDDLEIVTLDGVPGAVNNGSYFLPRGFAGVRRQEFSSLDDRTVWLAFGSASDEQLAAFEKLGYRKIEGASRSLINDDIRLMMLQK